MHCLSKTLGSEENLSGTQYMGREGKRKQRGGGTDAQTMWYVVEKRNDDRWYSIENAAPRSKRKAKRKREKVGQAMRVRRKKKGKGNMNMTGDSTRPPNSP
jgi:hypothetical protein